MYRKTICDTNPKNVWFTQGKTKTEIVLAVGNRYTVVYKNPTTNKDKRNNGRIVEVLGFTDSFAGDVIVKYTDNNRIGRLGVSCLLPY